MSIKEKLRNALLKEGKHSTSKYGCVMVYLKYDKEEWSELQDLIKSEDLYIPKDDTGYGRENKPPLCWFFYFYSISLYNKIKSMETNININWRLPKGKAIIGINNHFKKGLVSAKLTYETIDLIVEKGVNLERDLDLVNDLIDLNREGVLHFNKYDLEDKVEEFEDLQKEKKLEEANNWYLTLPEKEQQMVKVLQWSMLPSAR